MIRIAKVGAAGASGWIAAMALAATALAAAPGAAGRVAAPGGPALPEGATRDARLDARVTLAMPHAGLDTVLREAGRLSGVALSAGRSQGDWFSRELPVTVFAKGITVRSLMDQLATLTRFHWTAAGKADDRRYALWQDLKARDEQATLRAERKAEGKRARMRQALSSLDAMAHLSQASPRQLREWAEKEPGEAAIAAQPGFQSMSRILASLSEGQRLEATTEKGLRLPYSTLSPDMQAKFRDLVSGMAEFDSHMSPHAESHPPGDAAPRSFEGAEVWIRGAPDAVEQGQPYLSAITGEADLMGGHNLPGINEMMIFDPASPMGQAFGQMISRMAQGEPPKNAGMYMQSRLAGLLVNGNGSDPVPADPELLRVVKLKLPPTLMYAPRTCDSVLQALHEASGFDIVADSFPPPPGRIPAISAALAESLPVYKILAAVRRIYGLDFVKQGRLLRLQDRNWPDKRAGLIPQYWLARWRAQANSTDGVDLSTLMEMASALSQDQIGRGFAGDPRLGACIPLLNPRRQDMLRFLGGLTEVQRARLESGKPLAASDLAPDQFQSLQTAWAAYAPRAVDRNVPLSPGSHVTLSLTVPNGPPGPNEKLVPLGRRRSLMLIIENPTASGDPHGELRSVFLDTPNPPRPAPVAQKPAAATARPAVPAPR